VFGDRDNIDPPLLINSGTDFTAFGETGDFTPDSRSQTEGENQVDSTVKDLKNRAKGKKKRKHSLSPERQNIMGMFTRKWEDEKEERKETREMMRQELEANKVVNTEILGFMKSIADSFSHMAKD